MDDKKIIKRFYSLIFGLFLVFFSCESEKLNDEKVDFIRPNVQLRITKSDTTLFLNKTKILKDQLKCELLNAQFELEPEKLNFLGVNLKVESGVNMKNVYELIGMFQSIGYYRIYFSELGQSDKVIKYNAPNNFSYLEIKEIDCFSKKNHEEMSFHQRPKPPSLISKSELPACYLLIVSKDGKLSVADKLFTEEACRDYIIKQFSTSNKAVVGLEIDPDLEFRNYFKIMGLIYSTIEHLRNKEAEKRYNKKYGQLDKAEKRTIYRRFPKNVIEYGYNDLNHYGCGGMVKFDCI